MTQLKRDAAYIRSEPGGSGPAIFLSPFDEKVYETLSSAHTVVSATKALARSDARPAAGSLGDDTDADLEAHVAESMRRLLEAERIELSPDS